jgi:hypothetical protein
VADTEGGDVVYLREWVGSWMDVGRDRELLGYILLFLFNLSFFAFFYLDSLFLSSELNFLALFRSAFVQLLTRLWFNLFFFVLSDLSFFRLSF